MSTRPSTRQRKLEIYSWPSPLAGATKQIADLGDLEGGVPGAPVRWERRHPAGFVGHGGSRRQGETLKPRHFVVRTKCGRDARAPRRRPSPGGFTLPKATQPLLVAWNRQDHVFRLRVLVSTEIADSLDLFPLITL